MSRYARQAARLTPSRLRATVFHDGRGASSHNGSHSRAVFLWPGADVAVLPPDEGARATLWGPTMQTRLGSLAEAAANIAVGFTVNWCANMCFLPLFGFNVTGRQAFGIGCIFTVISLVRSYVLRRWFNGLKFGNKPA